RWARVQSLAFCSLQAGDRGDELATAVLLAGLPLAVQAVAALARHVVDREGAALGRDLVGPHRDADCVVLAGRDRIDLERRLAGLVAAVDPVAYQARWSGRLGAGDGV